MRGKRALELGAGMGLAGMALAFLGAGERRRLAAQASWELFSVGECLQMYVPLRQPIPALPANFLRVPAPPPPADVTFTDIGDVLPLLQRNVDQNISPAALKGARHHRQSCNNGRQLHRLSCVSGAFLLPPLTRPRSHGLCLQSRTRRGRRRRWARCGWRPSTGQTPPATRRSSRPTTFYWRQTASTANWLVSRLTEF